jgi:murein DD-endopeptidase / murein LD-carboxypeptidase
MVMRNRYWFSIKHRMICSWIVLCGLPLGIASHPTLPPAPPAATSVPTAPPLRFFTSGSLATKYAGLLKTDEAHVNKFAKLYAFIDQWMGTPYLWGGCGKSGIDCSCFVQKLFNQVFNINIKRTSLAQFCDRDVALFTNRNEYQLGDLIFFKTNIARETRNNRVTHVGFYLTNGYFVQSSSAGVNIASLNRGYWKSRIVAAGRLRENYYKKAGIAIPTGDTNNEKMDVEENSSFEPIPLAEEMDGIIRDYANLLNISTEKILIPEVFDFIEKNRYAPHNITSQCPAGVSNSNCLFTTLFRDVFAIEFPTQPNAVFLAKNTERQKGREDTYFMDVVMLQPLQKGGQENITGLYLFSGYLLYLQKNDLVIASLDDPAFKNHGAVFCRFNKEILKTAFANLVEKRKGSTLVPKPMGGAAQQPVAPVKPVNILKKDGKQSDSLTEQVPTADTVATMQPKKKKSKKKS